MTKDISADISGENPFLFSHYKVVISKIGKDARVENLFFVSFDV